MRRFLLLCVLVSVGCSHGPRGASVESLKSAAEQLHQRGRWRDWRGMAELVVADRREKFLADERKANDDRDLTITDYELLDVKLGPSGASGTVISRVHWLRLPSDTEKSEEVTSNFEFINGTWFLEDQKGGPFEGVIAP